MEIKEMNNEDRSAWDTYVISSRYGLPYHLSGWRDILANSYRYETHFLMAIESGKVVGVLPLIVVRSLLVGSRVTSVQGGICADTEETAAALIERGKEIADHAGVKQFVLQDTRLAWSGNLYTTSRHVHWILEFGSKRNSLWESLPRNVRYEVRKAQKFGLTPEVDYIGERLDDLYEVLSRFAHQAGSPFFERKFLEQIIQTFPGGYHSVLVYLKNRPIGGYFNLDMGNKSHGAWGATLPECLPLGATYLAYWAILCDASSRGFQTLDLGRSPTQSNSSKFKGRWGGISEPIYQQIIDLDVDHHEPSITNQIQSSGKYQLFIRIWPKLPFPVAQFLGPRLRRHVPFA